MTGLELLPLVGIVLLFWLLILRPASRRAKDQHRMQSELAVGDAVLLTSGFYATIQTLHDDRLDVEIAPGTTVTVARGAVGSVVHPESHTPDSYDETDTTPDVGTSKTSDPEES